MHVLFLLSGAASQTHRSITRGIDIQVQQKLFLVLRSVAPARFACCLVQQLRNMIVGYFTIRTACITTGTFLRQAGAFVGSWGSSQRPPPSLSRPLPPRPPSTASKNAPLLTTVAVCHERQASNEVKRKHQGVYIRRTFDY